MQPKDYATGEVLKGGGYGNKIAVDSNDNLHMAVGSRLYRCSSDDICDVIGTLDGEVDTMTFGQDGALYIYESTGRSTGDVASLRRVCLPLQSSDVKSESDASKVEEMSGDDSEDALASTDEETVEVTSVCIPDGQCKGATDFGTKACCSYTDHVTLACGLSGYRCGPRPCPSCPPDEAARNEVALALV